MHIFYGIITERRRKWMVLIIKNTTVLSSEEAIHRITELSRKYYYKKYIFSGILMVLGLTILLISVFVKSANDSNIIGYLFLAFGFILTGINTLSILTIQKKIKKQNPGIMEYGMVNSFTFKEESFQLQVKIGASVNKLEYPYNELKSITETDEYITFAISSLEAYLCKKDAFQSKKELEVFFYGLAKHKTKVKKKMSKNTRK